MNPRLLFRRLAAAIVPVALAGCAASAGDTAAEDAVAATAPVEVDLSPSELMNVAGISMGSEDAPAVIYEFADFQCPGCAQFALAATPVIKERYVEPGHARYVYYDFPLTNIHPNAFLAARAGRCANEQERFWEYHDILFMRQTQWAMLDDPIEPFAGYAAEIGIDEDMFEACLRSDRYAREVSANMALGEYLGVPGTPTLFVNGRRVEIQSLGDLERILEREIGAAAGD